MLHLRAKIEIRLTEPQSLDCDSKLHGLGTAPCEVLGIGSGFVRCTSDVLKTIIGCGNEPRAVKFMVLLITINPFSECADKAVYSKKASSGNAGKWGQRIPLNFVRFQFSEFSIFNFLRRSQEKGVRRQNNCLLPLLTPVF